ncbi:MAG: polysaccharide biosynthesis protein [Bacteroidetes bacterium]|nr:polysaccharide biosynthesis protein [Bacteroidota bacterium]
MVSSLAKRYSDKFLSRWIVFIFDSVTVYATFILANLIRHNFEYIALNPYTVERQSIIVLVLYLTGFLLTDSYRGIIRLTGMADALRLFKATGGAFLVLLFISLLARDLQLGKTYVPPLSVSIIHFLLAVFTLVGSRFVIKSIYSQLLNQQNRRRIRVVIYGAGAAGMLTRNALIQDVLFHYDIIAFIDDNSSKVNKTLEGIPVMSADKVLDAAFIKRNKVSQLIIAIQRMDVNYRNQVIEKGLDLNLQVKVVPPIDNWINGQLSAGQLRQVAIEELLERDPIRLDNEQVAAELHNKIIMVTGAAGSIGSEIARQVLSYKPGRLILVDQAESALFDLQQEINSKEKLRLLADRVVYVVASVKDRMRMEGLFRKYKPGVVYHAAAYKHVPLMEDHPYEAVMINVFGTKVLADLAVAYKVKKFVMVSTDKAVNPTNVMGATKRIAEMYVQCLSNGSTQFITTRFGNVLGSNGSVIPLFRKQIEKGGPVTITHRDITRYFMTIPEACNLVLEAGAMGNGGEIFVFDMGRPVKIIDLARKMIKLSGLVPDVDIRIEEVGLRPGEKLYEELLAGEENTIHTHHRKIMRARVREVDYQWICTQLNELSHLILDGDDFRLVEKMKAMVPEFISNNSVFEKLDQKTGGS